MIQQQKKGRFVILNLPVSTSTDGIERRWLDNGLIDAEQNEREKSLKSCVFFVVKRKMIFGGRWRSKFFKLKPNKGLFVSHRRANDTYVDQECQNQQIA